ncbi:MAG: DoxX family membrane protein [Planctomycetota bacterium]|jgi:putative oxidoreductase|nr:DoxX family membrane protein [Planctomycetota bacterium]
MARSDRNQVIGLVLIRVGIGIYLLTFGLADLLGGPARWTEQGDKLAYIGLAFMPAFWGFVASLAKLTGGILLGLGFLFRTTCTTLAVLMLAAAIAKIAASQGLVSALIDSSHAGSLLVIFAGLAFIGPGRIALDRRYSMTLTKRIERSDTASG